MSDTQTLHVRRVPSTLLKRLRIEAARRDVTIRQFVIDAIRAYLPHATTKEDA